MSWIKKSLLSPKFRFISLLILSFAYSRNAMAETTNFLSIPTIKIIPSREDVSSIQIEAVFFNSESNIICILPSETIVEFKLQYFDGTLYNELFGSSSYSTATRGIPETGIPYVVITNKSKGNFIINGKIKSLPKQGKAKAIVSLECAYMSPNIYYKGFPIHKKKMIFHSDVIINEQNNKEIVISPLSNARVE